MIHHRSQNILFSAGTSLQREPKVAFYHNTQIEQELSDEQVTKSDKIHRNSIVWNMEALLTSGFVWLIFVNLKKVR